ncbi:MAG: alkaline phosphatase family protein [Bryobacteraceae bacterium]|jgi:tetratricopeptide (TPR) repeat protein
MPERLARKVLFIGWDGADWKLIHPLLDQGLMPTLEQVVNQGVIGNLATLRPVLSPLVWNSIATGKWPDKHGILGFVEPDPVSGGVRPVTSTSRKVKAIWNILMQEGLRTHVVNWFAGHPAEPVSGVSVSPLYGQPTAPRDKPWPLPDGCIHPERLRDTLAEFRVHPGEMGPYELLPFVPRAAEVWREAEAESEPQEKSKKMQPLAGLAWILAETASVHNAATWILEHEPWDFAAVYYDAIDHFCHGFARFLPPRMEGIPEKEFEIYKEVVTSAYRFHDMMLERLLKLAGPQTTVVICSDHGFHSDHLRPRRTPKEPAGPAVWHRGHGILAMMGPGLRRDDTVYGAGVLDIAPTILTLFGLPVGRDMDGKVLVQAFEKPPTPEVIPSWEEAPGECGMHPADLRMDPEAAQALIQQFVALGYIEPPSEQQGKAVAAAMEESKLNLGEVYLSSGRARLALPLFEELAAQRPERARFSVGLAVAHMLLGQREEARKALAPLLKEDQARPWMEWLMGVAELQDRNPEDAAEHLAKAEEADPHRPALHVRLGQTYLRMRQVGDAERAFLKALSVDPDSAHAHLGLAMVRLRQRRHQEAAAEALEAVGLQHFFPSGHYFLGVALARLGQFDRAVLAFGMALSMAPGMAAAHRWLAAIHRRQTGDLGKAAYHRAKAWELRRKREAAVLAQ